MGRASLVTGSLRVDTYRGRLPILSLWSALPISPLSVAANLHIGGDCDGTVDLQDTGVSQIVLLKAETILELHSDDSLRDRMRMYCS